MTIKSFSVDSVLTKTYTPLYTSESKIEALTRVTIDSGSIPTSNETEVWIEEIEKRISEKAMGIQTVTGQYIDVQSDSLINAADYSWEYDIADGKLKFSTGGLSGTVIPLVDVKMPVLTVTHLYVNASDPDEATTWTELTQGPAASSSFMLLRTGIKDLGYALWFYDNEPDSGVARIKMDYTYGYNITPQILSDYCTYGVAIKVLLARMGSNTASGLSMLEGGGLGNFMPVQYADRIAEYRTEMAEIEAKFFPSNRSGPVSAFLV